LLFQVLMVHPVIRGVVTENDLDVLDYLLEVSICYFCLLLLLSHNMLQHTASFSTAAQKPTSSSCIGIYVAS
jgi:hypothetical protein